MSGAIQISKKQIIFALAGVAVAACLGVFVGSYIVQVRAENKAKPGSGLLLKTGQLFPQHRFVEVGDNQPALFESLRGKKSILLFLTTDCGYCAHAVAKWATAYPNISSQYQVYGIFYEKMPELKYYQGTRNLPFFIYNDSLGRFTSKYKIDVYPTTVGVNEEGKIAFISFGDGPVKSVEDYLKKF